MYILFKATKCLMKKYVRYDLLLEIQVHVELDGNGQTLTRVNASGIYTHINTYVFFH
jgi:hypothetical protein